MKMLFKLGFNVLMSSVLFACNNNSSSVSNYHQTLPNSRPLISDTLRGESPHVPMGAVIYGRDDDRFQEPSILDTYDDELAFFEREIDYVGHDNAFRMQRIYSSPTDFDFSRADEFVEWAISKSFRIHAHVLVFKDTVPEWAVEYRDNNTWTQQQWRDWIESAIRTMVGRYKGKVASWDVVNEPLARFGVEIGSHEENFWTGVAGDDVFEMAFKWAEEADPDAKLVMNEFYLFPFDLPKVDSLIRFANDLREKGCRIDVIGFQGIILFPVLAGSYSLNYAKFKKIADEGYNIVISELAIAINTSWLGIWPRQTKAQHKVQRMAFNNFARAYIDAVPESQRWGLSVWGVQDVKSVPHFSDIFQNLRLLATEETNVDWGAILDDDLNKKPAYFGYLNALKGRREMWTEDAFADMDADLISAFETDGDSDAVRGEINREIVIFDSFIGTFGFFMRLAGLYNDEMDAIYHAIKEEVTF